MAELGFDPMLVLVVSIVHRRCKGLCVFAGEKPQQSRQLGQQPEVCTVQLLALAVRTMEY